MATDTFRLVLVANDSGRVVLTGGIARATSAVSGGLLCFRLSKRRLCVKLSISITWRWNTFWSQGAWRAGVFGEYRVHLSVVKFARVQPLLTVALLLDGVARDGRDAVGIVNTVAILVNVDATNTHLSVYIPDLTRHYGPLLHPES